jgi:choline-sulfatase
MMQKPNILFIGFDDLNDWIGCLGGHPQVQTPHIDKIAKQGMLFTNAHCQSPLCTPSRTSCLTGRRPTSTGIYGLGPWIRSVLEFRNITTLPQYFATHGYQTLSTGKVFHDGHGTEEWNGPTFVGGYKNLPAKKLVQPSASNNPLMDWGIWPERDEDHDDAKIADWAVAHLQENALKPDQPWLMTVGFRNPHVPCYAPGKWFDLYPEATLQLPKIIRNDRDDTPDFSWYLHWQLPEPRLSWLEKNNQWKNLVRSYLASVSYVDSQVGRVLDTLRQTGQDKNTHIVLWSDHGWHLGEKSITGKNSLWEESVHVPLIVTSNKKAGQCHVPVELLDIFPTLCDLVGLPKPDWLDGQSLTPLLEKPKSKRLVPAITTHNPGNHAIRTERWRYIRYADGSEELYDKKRDPNEWVNLAQKPNMAKTKAELAQWLPKNERPHAPGSHTRILAKGENGEWLWEGKPIKPQEVIK